MHNVVELTLCIFYYELCTITTVEIWKCLQEIHFYGKNNRNFIIRIYSNGFLLYYNIKCRCLSAMKQSKGGMSDSKQCPNKGSPAKDTEILL